MAPLNLARLRRFVGDLTRVVARCAGDEPRLLDSGAERLAQLVAHDDWLPQEFAASLAGRYEQYLLHCDPLERFSVVSFVWGRGATSPIHDHTVWGLIGVLRGSELCEEFELRGGSPESTGSHRLERGQIDRVSPAIGDVHRVSNARTDGSSVSIHVYGANIGAVRRHTYDPRDGRQEFVSGYSNSRIPNLWDRSSEGG